MVMRWYTKNQHKCHLIPTPLAESLPPASNSAFDISQPKAGHEQWSCHTVLSRQTLPPQTLSACKASVIQPWNLPTSRNHSITSPLLCLSPLTLVFTPSPSLLYSLPHVFEPLPRSSLTRWTFSWLPSLHTPLHSSMTSRQAPLGLSQLLWWPRIVGYQLQF